MQKSKSKTMYNTTINSDNISKTDEQNRRTTNYQEKSKLESNKKRGSEVIRESNISIAFEKPINNSIISEKQEKSSTMKIIVIIFLRKKKSL